MSEGVFLRRQNILPKDWAEYPLFWFISIIIPVGYWFEMWVVLPELFSLCPMLYWFFFFLGHYILHNIVGNYLGILMTDTSIRGRVIPKNKEFGYCSICDTLTPPRSFHCTFCGICILKRDHHCNFLGCCIGFYNHRFFIFFVFYLTLTTIICTPFNVYFMSSKISFDELSFIFAAVCPISIFFFEFENENLNLNHVYFFVSICEFFGMFICYVWLYYHLQLVLKGTLVYEKKKSIKKYNLGKRKNLEMVFGMKWYLTWISPFLKSSLPCDGISFPVLEESSNENNEH